MHRRVLLAACAGVAAAQPTVHPEGEYHPYRRVRIAPDVGADFCETLECQGAVANTPGCACDIPCSGVHVQVSGYAFRRDQVVLDDASGWAERIVETGFVLPASMVYVRGERAANWQLRIKPEYVSDHGTVRGCAELLGSLYFHTTEWKGEPKTFDVNFGAAFYPLEGNAAKRFYGMLLMPQASIGPATAAVGWELAQTTCATTMNLGDGPGYLGTAPDSEADNWLSAVFYDVPAWLGGNNYGEKRVYKWTTGPDSQCFDVGATYATATAASTSCDYYPMAMNGCVPTPGKAACTDGRKYWENGDRVANVYHGGRTWPSYAGSAWPLNFYGVIQTASGWDKVSIRDGGVRQATCQWGGMGTTLPLPDASLVHRFTLKPPSLIDECCVDCMCPTCAPIGACSRDFQGCVDPDHTAQHDWRCVCVVGASSAAAAPVEDCAFDECTEADGSAPTGAATCGDAQNCVDPEPRSQNALRYKREVSVVAAPGAAMAFGEGPCALSGVAGGQCAPGLHCMHQPRPDADGFEAMGLKLGPGAVAPPSVCVFSFTRPVVDTGGVSGVMRLLKNGEGPCGGDSDCEAPLACMHQRSALSPPLIGFTDYKRIKGYAAGLDFSPHSVASFFVCTARARYNPSRPAAGYPEGEGPCENHADCAAGLRCFPRSRLSDPAANNHIPGVNLHGVGVAEYDAFMPRFTKWFVGVGPDVGLCYSPLPDSYFADEPPSHLTDWQCECRKPTVGAAVAMGPAPCILDECTTSSSVCFTCAGSICTDAGQACTDPDVSPSVFSDWMCSCVDRRQFAVGRPAQCLLEVDECTDVCYTCRTNLTCPTEHYNCVDTNVREAGDWMCVCPSGSMGHAQRALPICIARPVPSPAPDDPPTPAPVRPAPIILLPTDAPPNGDPVATATPPTEAPPPRTRIPRAVSVPVNPPPSLVPIPAQTVPAGAPAPAESSGGAAPVVAALLGGSVALIGIGLGAIKVARMVGTKGTSEQRSREQHSPSGGPDSPTPSSSAQDLLAGGIKIIPPQAGGTPKPNPLHAVFGPLRGKPGKGAVPVPIGDDVTL
eukprot:TRINITY_DN715_c0_g1_i5.p1 TRINITY_DN715_c0_g1~~TRINITY_DN715_c0_g1_i5.p1  ORF type:complete len:1056 (+),score=189.67 TRINITY_DN715_c0_g1_i5:76-3243(+)